MGAVALYLAMEFGTLDVDSSDLRRFPRIDAVRCAKVVYDQRLSWLHYQQSWYPAEYWSWQERIDELNLWYRAWDALGDAINANDDACRMRYLTKLRRLIGEANYAAGQMPHNP